MDQCKGIGVAIIIVHLINVFKCMYGVLSDFLLTLIAFVLLTNICNKSTTPAYMVTCNQFSVNVLMPIIKQITS